MLYHNTLGAYMKVKIETHIEAQYLTGKNQIKRKIGIT
jgi:hypothetical protein